MAYPSTVDTGLQSPWYLAHEGLAFTTNNTGTLVTNSTYLQGVFLEVGANLSNMRIRHSSPGAGNLDLGVYDANGNLLGHTGIIAATGANSVNTAPFSTGQNLWLSQGAYYLALWVDNSTDVYYNAALSFNPTGFANTLIGNTPVGGGLLATFAAMGGTTASSKLIGMMATIAGRSF